MDKLKTLNEAIAHSIELSRKDDSQAAKEHGQLAKWLQELKELRKEKKNSIDRNALAQMLCGNGDGI
jgi:hypothetical protein